MFNPSSALFQPQEQLVIRRAMTAAILVVTLLMALATLVYLRQQEASENAKTLLVHTYAVTGHIQLLFNRLKDVELGQRGYLLAGDEKYLEPYKDALKNSLGKDAKSDRMEQHHSIAEELEILRNLTKDSPEQQQNLEELNNYITEAMVYWNHSVELKRQKGIALNLDNLDFDHGNQRMDHIRSLVSIMMAEENNLLVTRTRDAQDRAYQNNFFTFMGLALFYFIMIFSIWVYQRARIRANTQLLQHALVLQNSEVQLKKQQSELQELVTKLAHSNTELERFAYVASHDMQEPLRMITNFSDLIAEEYGKHFDETGREYLAMVTSAATRMQALICDLLEYARLGNDATRFQDINVNEELKHVLENLSTAITEHKAAVSSDLLPNIWGNPIQFMRLLQNLIGNGLKYQNNDNKPSVHVAVKASEEGWCFSVRDNGIGIKREYLDRIFEPFKRLHSWQQYQGTGLGLSVCKKIVEGHGGRIWAESEFGKGSVFYFTIPSNDVRKS